MWNIIILFLLTIFVLLVSIYEHRNFTCTYYNINSKKLPKEFTTKSIVVLSDLHNCGFGDKCRRLIKKIDEINPDLIIIAGDMIIKRKTYNSSSIAVKLIEALAKKYNIYYGLGNHEERERYYNNSEFIIYKEHLEGLGVKFLDNEYIKINGLKIYGLNIELDYYYKSFDFDKEYIESLLERTNSNDYNILIAHHPEYFKEYVNWGADLILSGHLHGGIMRLPLLGGIISPRFRLFPKYYGGLYEKDNKKMIVSRGLGTHTIKIRIFNKPELINIKLYR